MSFTRPFVAGAVHIGKIPRLIADESLYAGAAIESSSRAALGRSVQARQRTRLQTVDTIFSHGSFALSGPV